MGLGMPQGVHGAPLFTLLQDQGPYGGSAPYVVSTMRIAQDGLFALAFNMIPGRTQARCQSWRII
ncbi:UNVERIFIED_CONTAM: hypothetical protein Slati_4420300 [Sesamum latifolium]|uniref:Uncharacterized protein n=1 Tax=Sesamum latifolium TaxID=2727402 RepID=A0AAW2SSP2_9LAMI